MIIIKILALVDIHTLFVLIFHNSLPFTYVLAGATFPIMKGLVFFLPNKDVFSFIDIVIGFIMLILLFGSLWSFVWWIIFFYLVYKILFSFVSF